MNYKALDSLDGIEDLQENKHELSIQQTTKMIGHIYAIRHLS
jgi:hypothetical protein